MVRPVHKKIFLVSLLLCLFLLAANRLVHLVVADIYASMAEQHFRVKDYSAAERYLAASLLHNAGNPEYHRMLARSLHARAGETEDPFESEDFLRRAREHLAKSVELNPREGNAWLDLAQVCWWLSRFPELTPECDSPESCFVRALETDPNNGKFLYAMVNYCLSTSPPDICLPTLQKLALVYPDAYYPLKEHPRWTDSLRLSFKQGLLTAVENPLTGRQALSVLACIAGEEKDWGSAVAHTEEFIRRSGRDISSYPYITLGRFLLRQLDLPRAKAAFLQALRLSKNRQQTLQSFLSACMEADAFDLYVDLCRETARFDPVVRNNLALILGKACFQSNRIEEAQNYLQQSLDLKETPEARCCLAEIALIKKDWDTAEIQSQRATVLDPKNSHCYYLLARALEAQKKYQPALEAIGEAIRYANPPQESYYALQEALRPPQGR